MTRPNHTPPKLTRIANILGCGDSREQAIDESLQTARAYLRNRVAKALA